MTVIFDIGQAVKLSINFSANKKINMLEIFVYGFVEIVEIV